jgi:hypothetical protein
MLERALAAWAKVPESERLLPEEPEAAASRRFRAEAGYPEDGLVLRCYARDLPRGEDAPAPADWRATSWNQDFVWFTAAEARSLVPGDAKAGDVYVLPKALVRRLVRCHLVDNVNGQTASYRPNEIEHAELDGTIARVDGDNVTMTLRGRTLAAGEHRSMAARLYGTATFDRASVRFTAFVLVADANSTGATRYNARDGDPGPAPLGIVFTLAGDGPAERVAPAFLHAYDER